MKHPSSAAREKERQYQRDYYARNKDKAAKRWKKYYRANRLKVIEGAKAHYQKNKKQKRAYMVEYKFGLTKEQHAALKKKQKNRCAICGGKQVKPFKELAVDHDHKTGKVRGLLCNPCNSAVGSMKDDPKRLWKAALYLRKAH